MKLPATQVRLINEANEVNYTYKIRYKILNTESV